MLITDQTKLLSLLVILQDEINLFLEITDAKGTADADPADTDKTACSELFREISSFLRQAAEADFRQFKDRVWMMFVDESKAPTLIPGLRADIQLFITALESNPTGMNDHARSEFLQRIFGFLERSVTIVEEPQDERSPPPAPPNTPVHPDTPVPAASLFCHCLGHPTAHADTANCVDCKARSIARSPDSSPQSVRLSRRKRKNILPGTPREPPALRPCSK